MADWLKISMWAVGILLILLMAYSFFQPTNYKVPRNFQQRPITGPFSDVLSFIGVPDEWLYTPGIIYLFIIPLTGVIVIVYGFLDSMQIFPNINVNLILSIVIGFGIIPVGVFTKMVTLLFGIMGAYSTAAFTFLFIFGIVAVIKERMGGWGFGGRGRTEGQALQQGTLYQELLVWSRDTINRNLALAATNVALDQLLREISNVITRAESEARFVSVTTAVQMLRTKARTAKSDIERHGGSTLPLPHGV